MKWGVAIWALLYGGGAALLWAATDLLVAATFLAGTGWALIAVYLAEWMTREKTVERRIYDADE